MKHKKRGRYPTTDVTALALPVVASLNAIESKLGKGDPTTNDAFNVVSVFCAIALRVMSKTPVDLLQSECRTVEIGTRLTAMEQPHK